MLKNAKTKEANNMCKEVSKPTKKENNEYQVLEIWNDTLVQSRKHQTKSLLAVNIAQQLNNVQQILSFICIPYMALPNI